MWLPLRISCILSLRKNLDLEEPHEELCTAIVVDTTHAQEVVRSGAALALAQVLEKHPSHIPAILQTLLDLYEEKLYVSYVSCYAISFLVKLFMCGINCVIDFTAYQ